MSTKKRLTDQREVIAGRESQHRHQRIEATPTWVKAKTVASYFDVSLKAVYVGDCGLDRIRSAYLPNNADGGRSGKKRRARRFLWEDVLKLHKEMLAEAERQEEIPEGILKLMGGAWRRRRKV